MVSLSVGYLLFTGCEGSFNDASVQRRSRRYRVLETRSDFLDLIICLLLKTSSGDRHKCQYLHTLFVTAQILFPYKNTLLNKYFIMKKDCHFHNSAFAHILNI